MNRKIAMFVDVENLIKSFRETTENIRGAFIDFHDMRELLAEGRDISYSKAYSTYSSEYGVSTILREMEIDGFDLELEKNGGRKQKGVDVRMSLGINKAANQNNCDTIIIVSGDADFVPAVRVAKELNKNVLVASFRCSLSENLANEADDVIELDSLCMVDTRGIRRDMVERKYSSVAVDDEITKIGVW